MARSEFDGHEGINCMASDYAQTGSWQERLIHGYQLCGWQGGGKKRGNRDDTRGVIPCDSSVETWGFLQCLFCCGIAGLHDCQSFCDTWYCEYWGVINHPLFFLQCDCIVVHPLLQYNRWWVKERLNPGLQ